MFKGVLNFLYFYLSGHFSQRVEKLEVVKIKTPEEVVAGDLGEPGSA